METITPHDYFLKLKDSIKEINDTVLEESYTTISKLAEKYNKSGQIKSLEKLKFLTEVLKSEQELLKLGITKFLYRDTIEDYIEHVSDKVVKIIELKDYMRELPDEIVETVEKTKNLFNKFYVVFTDYTGKEERRVNQEKRDKDPILFGVFTDRMIVSDRFYYLGDWIDEECDLTLDKLVSQYKEKKKVSPEHPVMTLENMDKLISTIKSYIPEPKDETRFVIDSYTSKKKSFFDKVKSVFKSNG